jgi:hypothetical protein
MEGQLSPVNIYNILIVFQHHLVLFVCAKVFFYFTFCNFFLFRRCLVEYGNMSTGKQKKRLLRANSKTKCAPILNLLLTASARQVITLTANDLHLRQRTTLLRHLLGKVTSEFLSGRQKIFPTASEADISSRMEKFNGV